jgi:hypothetical protein
MQSPEHFRVLIEQHLGKAVLKYEVERKPYPMQRDTRPDASWRDHLLHIFSARLRTAEQHQADPALITDLKDFIAALERLPRTVELYCWSAHTKDAYYSGWASVDRIIHTTRSN